MITTNETCSFTGHRTKDLFGTWELNNERAKILAEELLKVIEFLIVEKGVTTFISGGALGADQLAFMCVHKLKKKYPHIKNILASPFENQAFAWKNKKDLLRYEKIKKEADKIIQVDTLSAYNDSSVPIGQYSAKKMQLRNIFMVDRSQYVIAIFNGKEEGGTYNCVNYAKKNNKEILTLDPNNDFKLVS